jgi:plastocyanin
VECYYHIPLMKRLEIMKRFFAGLNLLLTTSSALALDVNGSVLFKNKPQPNNVVWIDAPSLKTAPPKKPVLLDQRNLTFLPTVLAIQAGSTVEFPNNDRVFHNVFSLRDGKKFDLGLYPMGAVKKLKFEKVGLSRIFCNIHPNMAAYIYAVDTPFFAVTNAKGRFTIRDIPPGTYQYHVWRPGDKTLHGTITLPAANWEVRWP